MTSKEAKNQWLVDKSFKWIKDNNQILFTEVAFINFF